MIESELIYHNPDIQNHRIDYIEYRKIIEAVDRHIEKEKNPQSNSVELLKAAKEFLVFVPLRGVSIYIWSRLTPEGQDRKSVV